LANLPYLAEGIVVETNSSPNQLLSR